MYLQSSCDRLQICLRIAGLRVLNLRNRRCGQANSLSKVALAHVPVLAPFLDECPLERCQVRFRKGLALGGSLFTHAKLLVDNPVLSMQWG